MEQRIVEFIRGLRAAGVRVSLAESMDAIQAVGVLGITDKDVFQATLRATLIKESDDRVLFEELFPYYFGSGGPPLQNAMDDLSPDEQDMLKMALQALSGRLDQLMDWLTSGEGPTKEELEEMAQRAGSQWANNPNEARWVTRRMLREMGFSRIEGQMQQLMQKLQEMGMSQEAINKLMGVVEANREALAEQVAQQVGRQIAEQRANQPTDLHGSDLMYKSFNNLTEDDLDKLRKEVQRLVTQLRSRAALRRKRGVRGKFDSKNTIRANQRYGGVPMELKFKKKKLKPSLVLLCDVSGSMRNIAEFMLRLVHELQDQVSKTRSFAYYWDLVEISDRLAGTRNASNAITDILQSVLPYRPYGTDLGFCLDKLHRHSLDAINGRSTVVVLGDGRNNYNAPRIDLLKDIQRRARRLIWLCPEGEREWGTDDSDMLDYAHVPDAIYVVRNMAQLSSAIDKLIVDT
jgi:uncharacterized protein